MWVTESCYRDKRLIGDDSGHHIVFLGPVLFHFKKDDQTFTRFTLELQARSLETRKLKKIGVAIFHGVESLFPNMSKLYCVRHMKQRDEIKIGKLLVKLSAVKMKRYLKCSRKKYWQEKIWRILQNLCFFTSFRLRPHQNYVLRYSSVFFRPLITLYGNP